MWSFTVLQNATPWTKLSGGRNTFLHQMHLIFCLEVTIYKHVHHLLMQNSLRNTNGSLYVFSPSEMVDCFNEIAGDPDCRVVVVSAAGKIFTAGGYGLTPVYLVYITILFQHIKVSPNNSVYSVNACVNILASLALYYSGSDSLLNLSLALRTNACCFLCLHQRALVQYYGAQQDFYFLHYQSGKCHCSATCIIFFTWVEEYFWSIQNWSQIYKMPDFLLSCL